MQIMECGELFCVYLDTHVTSARKYIDFFICLFYLFIFIIYIFFLYKQGSGLDKGLPPHKQIRSLFIIHKNIIIIIIDGLLSRT